MSDNVIFSLPHNQIKVEQKEVLEYLCDLCNAKNILELGSWLGESTAVLASKAKKNNGLVSCVDLWKGNDGTALSPIAKENDIKKMFIHNMFYLGLLDNIEIFECDTQRLPEINKTFDLIFIDADHRYENVKRDINNCLNKLNSGGILCGHDCEGFLYDEKYINIDCFNSVHHGVCKAVSELLPNARIDREIWWIKK